MDISGRIPRPGQVLAGRYRLQEIIARGGMAEVWDAVDVLLARPVAVKMPLARLEGQEIFRQRFQREAIAAASLTHPNVVAIYDTGVDASRSFIVMERVRGRSLLQVLADGGALSAPRSVAMAVQVATALDFAHRAGVIHRDVKPANILLTEDDSVKVTDFGIAKAARDEDLTLSGVTLGTARYLAPEQVEGKPVDRRCDIYSLGVVIFEMLCGRTPFDADTDLALAVKHVWAEPPAPTTIVPGIPLWLEAVVLRALAKSPDDRYPTAADLAKELRNGEPALSGLITAERPAETAYQRLSRPARASTTVTLNRPGWRPSERGGSPGDHGRSPSDWRHGPSDRLRAPSARDSGPSQRQRGANRPNTRRLVPAVAAVVLVAAIIAAVVLVLHARPLTAPAPGASATAPAVSDIRVIGATAFDPMGDGMEDDADLAKLYDGNPATSWHTDQYATQDFGHLKQGVGFVLELSSGQRLGHLTLVTSTPGWDAKAYVSGAPKTDLATWGSPAAAATNVSGRVSVDLRGRSGAAVLVWITRLGPGRQVSVGEARLTG